MIGLRTAVRVMPVIWFAIPISIFTGWYATITPSVATDGYAVAATAAGTATLAFVGPFVAGCAAWEGSRLRRADVWSFPSVRSRLAIAFWWLLPVVLVGLFAVVIAITVELIRSSAGLPDLRFLAVTVLDLVAFSAAGFAAGLLLPFAVAGPLAAVGAFIWLAFIPAMPPVWMRHLTGMFRDCCALQDDLAPRAIFAASIVDVGIISAAALLVAGPALLARRLGATIATLTVAGVAGVLLVGSMTYAPTIPRDSILLECRTGASATICLWPEHRSSAADIAAIVETVRAGWANGAIDSPALITEADSTIAPPGALAIRLAGAAYAVDDIVGALASGMLPEFPDCATGATGAIAFDYLQAWYSAAGGMTKDGLARRYSGDSDPYPEILTVVDQLSAATPDVRRAWLSRAEQVTQSCEDWPLSLILVGE